MFNIGPGEIIVIGLVLLIAVGPEQLPGVIRRVGKTVSQVRGMTDSLRTEFMAGLDEIEQATDMDAWADRPRPKPSIEAVPNPFAGERRNDDDDDDEDLDGDDVDDDDLDADDLDGADFDDDESDVAPAVADEGADLDDSADLTDGEGAQGQTAVAASMADDADAGGPGDGSESGESAAAAPPGAPDAATRLERQSRSVTDWISDWSDDASERIAKQSEEASARVAEQSQRIKNGFDDGEDPAGEAAAEAVGDDLAQERDTA